MKSIGRLLGLESTRGQIFTGTVFTMLIVMCVMFYFIYTFLAQEKKESTMLYIEEIAQQAGGRLESLLNEINVLTLQMAMDERMQTILSDEYYRQPATYEDRMKLRKLMLDMTAYSDTIEEVELYSRSRSIYPIVEGSIESRVDKTVIDAANHIHVKGSLVWAGQDPNNEQYLLAIRQVKLEKHDYVNGGYLVVKVKPNLIQLATSNDERANGAIMRVVQQDKVLLATDEIAGKLDEYFIFERNIKGTSWKLQMMMQKKLVLSELYWLRGLLMIFFIVSIAFFAAMSYYLSSLIASPIMGLIRIMQGSKHGKPKHNPTKYFNKEVNQLNTTYNQMVDQIDYLIKSVYEKELLKSRSEIRALHSQINPHFLFNTLDAIYWDHIEKGEKEMASIVVQLADLFRYSIHSSQPDGFVTIKEELEQVERYANLMKLRWEDRLTLHISCEEELLAVKVPKLIVQPLVENAIVHGIEPLSEGGIVKVNIYARGTSILIRIEDNGIGMEPQQVEALRHKLQQSNEATLQQSKRGIGLYNVNRLLKLHYGERYGLHISSLYQSGTTMTLELPIIEKEKGNELQSISNR